MNRAYSRCLKKIYVLTTFHNHSFSLITAKPTELESILSKLNDKTCCLIVIFKKENDLIHF